MHQQSVESAYEGDVFHETPLALIVYSYITNLNTFALYFLFILTDVLTALVLARASQLYFQTMVSIILNIIIHRTYFIQPFVLFFLD